MRSTLSIIAFFVALGGLAAQEGYRNRGPALLPSLSYAFQLPAGDLQNRFGNGFSLGLGFDYLTPRSQWLFGLQGTFTFGNVVREDVLSNLRTPEGFIYGNNKGVANLGLRQRGLFLGARGGKVIPLSEANPRSGLRLTLGLGYWEHRIRISEDPASVVPQVTGPYRTGYDRLTSGLALRQFVGYQHLSNDGRLNFFAGIELTEGFTRHRRAVRFNTGDADTPSRFDMTFGFRLGWILPLYLGEGEDIFY